MLQNLASQITFGVHRIVMGEETQGEGFLPGLDFRVVIVTQIEVFNKKFALISTPVWLSSSHSHIS